MSNDNVTKQIIQAGILELLKHLQHYHTIEVPMEEYFKVHSNKAVDDRMHQVLHHWVNGSNARMKRLDSMEPGAVLEVLHIGGNLPLPAGELQVYLAEFLARAGGYGIEKEAALAAMACGEIAWCVCPSVTGELVIGFNEAEVTIFVNTIKQTAGK